MKLCRHGNGRRGLIRRRDGGIKTHCKVFCCVDLLENCTLAVICPVVAVKRVMTAVIALLQLNCKLLTAMCKLITIKRKKDHHNDLFLIRVKIVTQYCLSQVFERRSDYFKILMHVIYL